MSTFVQDDSIEGTTTSIIEIAARAPLYAYNTDLSNISRYSYVKVKK